VAAAAMQPAERHLLAAYGMSSQRGMRLGVNVTVQQPYCALRVRYLTALKCKLHQAALKHVPFYRSSAYRQAVCAGTAVGPSEAAG
jgi:hypothetical protein